MLRANVPRTASASSFGRIVAARAGSHLNPARIATGQRHGRVGSSGGTTGVRRIASRPSSSRISPDSPPAIDGPSRARGGSGGGPAGGATSVKATTPSSSTSHRTPSHQSSGPVDGRDMPARNCRSPIRSSISRRNDGPGGGSRSGTGGGYPPAGGSLPSRTPASGSIRRGAAFPRSSPPSRPVPQETRSHLLISRIPRRRRHRQPHPRCRARRDLRPRPPRLPRP